jgi:hypothetical protein
MIQKRDCQQISIPTSYRYSAYEEFASSVFEISVKRVEIAFCMERLPSE